MRLYSENNFETTVTSPVSAGATTTPLDDIPTVSAPFYLTFDPDDTEGHYEEVLVTSKTATHVNHAALTYAHGAAEVVRMTPTASLLNNNNLMGLAHQQGALINGKIVPSVSSNNLTVAIKTLAGTDPSSADPVSVRIGDSIRTLTAALSVTKNAATNWCNAGGAELATKEIDYFVYLGYNATDGVVIGFSRIPSGNQYDDFSATTTNEKYCGISTITNAAAGDDYELVGRFAATLSAGAGYTWSVPAFTTKNLIQRPIYETRWLSWQPAYSAGGAMSYTSVTTNLAKYKVRMSECIIQFDFDGTTGGTASPTLHATIPFSSIAYELGLGIQVSDTANGVGQAFFYYSAEVNKVACMKYNWTNFTLGANRKARAGNISYEIG